MNHIRRISQNQYLDILYRGSQRKLNKFIRSAHSGTLDKLFCDEFRPDVLNNGKTKILNIRTNKPVIATLINDRTKNEMSDFIEFVLKSDNKLLKFGRKNFLLRRDETGRALKIDGGFMESFWNNSFAGTQIRLLQACCEYAQKYNINKISLDSLVAPVVFHTKMGFRPEPDLRFQVKNAEELFNIYYEFANTGSYFSRISEKDIVITKKDNKHYFDYNRSLFVKCFRESQEKLNHLKKRNLDIDFDDDIYINMSLEGKQLEKWFERIKGFEILDDNECIPEKLPNIFVKIFTIVKNFL